MNQKFTDTSGWVEGLKDELLQKGIATVFVVMGTHLLESGIGDGFFCFPESVDIHRFIKKTQNVLMHEVDDCFEKYNKTSATAIIAIGGGSVIDLAKGVISRCIENNLSIPYFIAIPTTAGSGSEATGFAVVYRNKKKLSYQNELLQPASVFLDATLTESLSPKQTAISGIDAFAQAIESMWNIHSTAASQKFSEESIVILRDCLLKAVHTPVPELRRKMLWAAHLAGCAINITRTTGPHALSYYLTSYYNVPHGQAVALFLPVFFLYNDGVDMDNAPHPPGIQATKNSMGRLYNLLNVANAAEAFGYFRELMRAAGLATTFQELFIDKKLILEPLMNEVNAERFNNNPVRFNKVVLTELIDRYL
jgi:alcohol dehydrogenase class IV